MSLFVREKVVAKEKRRMHYFYQDDFDIDSLDNIIQQYKKGSAFFVTNVLLGLFAMWLKLTINKLQFRTFGYGNTPR